MFTGGTQECFKLNLKSLILFSGKLYTNSNLSHWFPTLALYTTSNSSNWSRSLADSTRTLHVISLGLDKGKKHFTLCPGPLLPCTITNQLIQFLYPSARYPTYCEGCRGKHRLQMAGTLRGYVLIPLKHMNSNIRSVDSWCWCMES